MPTAGWRECALLEKTIVQLFPSAVPVPFLMVGAVESPNYERLTRNVFRLNQFVPTLGLLEQAARSARAGASGGLIACHTVHRPTLENAQRSGCMSMRDSVAVTQGFWIRALSIQPDLADCRERIAPAGGSVADHRSIP
jgi:hypothetical protein